MPDWGDAIRQRPDDERKNALLRHAMDDVKNAWNARSWSDVGSAALYKSKAIAVFFSKQGVKFLVNWASGGLAGTLADWAAPWVPQLGEGFQAAVLEHVTGEIWDKVKDIKLRGMSYSDLEEFGGKIEAVLDSELVAKAKQEAEAALDLEDPEKAFKSYVNAVSELAIHAATFKKYMEKGQQSGFTYCDEVFYLGVELAQIVVLKAKIATVGPKLAAYMTYVNTLAGDVAVDKMQNDLKLAAESVVKSTAISHKNHSNPNVVSAATSCSKQHCYGQGQGEGWSGWASKKLFG